jgi:two-component sensor histidine kinase
MQGDFARTFEGRLAALSRANNAISLEGSVDLVGLLSQELIGRCGDLSRFTLKGPTVVIRRDSAFALALLFRELACNAAQHGSLSCPEGRVEVDWHVENEMLGLTWAETGGPLVQRPLAHGVGNFLIKHAAAKLDGTANLLYMPSGFRCELRVSLSACWPKRRAAMFLAGKDHRSGSFTRNGLGRMG